MRLGFMAKPSRNRTKSRRKMIPKGFREAGGTWSSKDNVKVVCHEFTEQVREKRCIGAEPNFIFNPISQDLLLVIGAVK